MPLEHLLTYSGDSSTTVTNAANGVEDYIYIYFGQITALYAFLTFTITNMSIKLYATADNNSVANASATWFDITNDLIGVGSFSSTSHIRMNTPESFDRLRIGYTPSNAVNSLVFRINKSR